MDERKSSLSGMSMYPDDHIRAMAQVRSRPGGNSMLRGRRKRRSRKDSRKGESPGGFQQQFPSVCDITSAKMEMDMRAINWQDVEPLGFDARYLLNQRCRAAETSTSSAQNKTAAPFTGFAGARPLRTAGSSRKGGAGARDGAVKADDPTTPHPITPHPVTPERRFISVDSWNQLQQQENEDNINRSPSRSPPAPRSPPPHPSEPTQAEREKRGRPVATIVISQPGFSSSERSRNPSAACHQAEEEAEKVGNGEDMGDDGPVLKRKRSSLTLPFNGLDARELLDAARRQNGDSSPSSTACAKQAAETNYQEAVFGPEARFGSNLLKPWRCPSKSKSSSSGAAGQRAEAGQSQEASYPLARDVFLEDHTSDGGILIKIKNYELIRVSRAGEIVIQPFDNSCPPGTEKLVQNSLQILGIRVTAKAGEIEGENKASSTTWHVHEGCSFRRYTAVEGLTLAPRGAATAQRASKLRSHWLAEGATLLASPAADSEQKDVLRDAAPDTTRLVLPLVEEAEQLEGSFAKASGFTGNHHITHHLPAAVGGAERRQKTERCFRVETDGDHLADERQLQASPGLSRAKSTVWKVTSVPATGSHAQTEHNMTWSRTFSGTCWNSIPAAQG